MTLEELQEALNEERAKLQKELDALTVETGELTEEETIRIVQDLDDILERNDFNEIRQLIDLLIDHIEIDNEDVYIHWKFL